MAYTKAKPVPGPAEAAKSAEGTVADLAGIRPSAPRVRPDRPLRLLVVCANLVDRRLIEALLTPPMVDLVVAESDREAVALWTVETFDAALLDLQSVDCDGLTTARKLRNAERPSSRGAAPIVIMSHQVVLDHLDDEAKAHVDAFLTKPISPANLTETLSSLAGRAI